jgi:hypothetical protein
MHRKKREQLKRRMRCNCEDGEEDEEVWLVRRERNSGEAVDFLIHEILGFFDP